MSQRVQKGQKFLHTRVRPFFCRGNNCHCEFAFDLNNLSSLARSVCRGVRIHRRRPLSGANQTRIYLFVCLFVYFRPERTYDLLASSDSNLPKIALCVCVTRVLVANYNWKSLVWSLHEGFSPFRPFRMLMFGRFQVFSNDRATQKNNS